MIRRKLADMAMKIFAVESMGYRTAGMIDVAVEALDHKAPDFIQQAGKTFEEYSIECSIIKVMGSDAAAVIIDEAVQIHGGYGFCEEYEVARNYRDERINRIFEGTNEINRLLMPATLLKRSMTGRLPVMPAYMKLVNRIRKDEDGLLGQFDGPLCDLAKMVESARQLTVYAFGTTLRQNMAQIQKADFVMGMGEYYFELLADMIMPIFAMDSSVTRAGMILEERGEEKAANAVALARLVCFDGLSTIAGCFRTLASGLSHGNPEQLAVHRTAGEKLTYFAPMDVIGLQEQVAARIVDFERYVV